MMRLNFSKIIQISILLVEGIVFSQEEGETNNFISLAHEVLKIRVQKGIVKVKPLNIAEH